MRPTTDDLLGVASKVQNGTLRHDSPIRTRGGMGNGRSCDACGRPIDSVDLELEAEYDDGRTTVRFHDACFSAWQRAAEQKRRSTTV